MKKVLLIAAITVAAFFISVNFIYEHPKTFIKGTEINGMDVSGLTPEQASEALTEKWNSNELTINYETRETLPIDLQYKITDNLEKKLKPDYKQKLRYIFGLGNKFRIKMQPEPSEKFLKQISGLQVCDNGDREKTKNARVDLSDTNFRVFEEVVGTEVDPKRVEDIVLENIANGNFDITLTESDIVKLPEITKDSQEIKDRLEYCKKNLSYTITYEVDGNNITLTPAEIDKMVKYGEKTKVDSDEVEKFVEKLAEKYNEYHKTYDFKTSYGSTISVYAVTYGRILNKDKEKDYLMKALKAQKDDTHELVWSQDKYEHTAGIGNSYIEVSISGQHVWLYKDGQCIVSADCVTGAPGHDTAKGVYTIQYITGPTTLKGNNDDGTKYESKVNCFMPFWGGQGLHGSGNWRSSWGGKIYKTNGSHGCINLPDKAAKTIANNISSGYPIVIY